MVPVSLSILLLLSQEGGGNSKYIIISEASDHWRRKMLSDCLAGMTVGGHHCNSFVVQQFLNSITQLLFWSVLAQMQALALNSLWWIATPGVLWSIVCPRARVQRMAFWAEPFRAFYIALRSTVHTRAFCIALHSTVHTRALTHQHLDSLL